MSRTEQSGGLRTAVVRRPVASLLTLVLAVGIPLLTVAVLADVAVLAILVISYLLLAGGALLLTRWVEGPGAPRRLLGRLVRWRFGIGPWLIIVLAMPVLTAVVAAATGTLVAPERGLLAESGRYLLFVFVIGALLLNLAEELGWTGFVQRRLMDRHGLLGGAVLTAIPFAALHVPLAFEPGWTTSSAVLELTAIVALAPFLRYLLGALYLDTGGSLLAVGLMHASYNASGQLAYADGGWQFLPAGAVLALAVGAARLRRHENAVTVS